MFATHWFILSSLSIFLNVHCSQYKTFIRNDRNILLRRRRALEFPEGSNMVFTLSFVKAVMVRKPKGYMSLLECDVPFKLPSASDRRSKNKFRYERSAALKSKWMKVFDRLGVDGESCVKRIICEAEAFVKNTNTSIMSRIIHSLFSDYFGGESCLSREGLDCILPSLTKILGSILRLQTFNY